MESKINNSTSPGAKPSLSASNSHKLQQMRALKRGEKIVEGWPEPIPLTRDIDDPFPYPVEALGDVFAPATQRIHEVTGAEIAIAAQSVLSTACLLVQGVANVTFDGRKYAISNYFMTLAGSGDRKSECDRAASLPVVAFQETAYRKYLVEKKEYDKKLEISKHKYNKSEKETKKGSTAPSLIEDVGDPPRNPMFVCEAPTIEGLLRQLEEGQPSQGLFSDEGARMLSGYSLKDENKLSSIAALSSLWDGNRAQGSPRSTRPVPPLFNRRLSMHLMLQPAIAAKFLNDREVQEQGLLARILTTAPRQRPPANYVPVDLSQDATMKSYYARINTLLAEEIVLFDEPDMGIKFRDISLDAKAIKLWTAFHNDTEHWRQRNGKYGNVYWFAARSAEHVIKTSGALALIENIRASVIKACHIERAILIVMHHLNEIQRLTEGAGDNEWISLVQSCLLWMQKQKKNQDGIILFSVRDLYQCGPSGARKKDEAMKIIEVLEEFKWIRQHAETRQFEVYPSQL